MGFHKLKPHLKFLRHPIFVCILGVVLMFAIWKVLNDQRTSNLNLILTKESELAALLLEENIQLSERSIRRFVKRWEISGQTSQVEFFADAYSYLNVYPGLEAIQWIDADSTVRWIASSTGEDITPFLNRKVGEDQQQQLNLARRSLIPTMMSPSENRRGTAGFQIYFPINVNGKFVGVLLAKYSVEDWVNDVLENTRFINNLSYIIRIDGEISFVNGNFSELNQNFKGESLSSIKIFEHEINVEALFNGHFFNFNVDYTPEITAAFGMFLIILIALALHYYQQSNYVEAQAKARSDFLAQMSHELRTPLNSIIGFSEMISSEVFGKIGSEKYVEYIRDIQKSGYHLLQLVNDVLDLSKIQAGKHELFEEVVDLNELLVATINMIKGRKEAQSLNVQCTLPEKPLRIKGDERALRQVLLNLLSNAIKYNKCLTSAFMGRIRGYS